MEGASGIPRAGEEEPKVGTGTFRELTETFRESCCFVLFLCMYLSFFFFFQFGSMNVYFICFSCVSPVSLSFLVGLS